jgi:hypothetical protein
MVDLQDPSQPTHTLIKLSSGQVRDIAFIRVHTHRSRLTVFIVL